MNKKSSLKAEDILMDENYPKSISPKIIKNTRDVDNKEIQIAHRIYSFLTSNQSVFPINEKEKTKKRIKTSVRKLRCMKQLIRLSAAAVILVICVLVSIWYFQLNSNSVIVNFAQTLNKSIPEKDTRLILQDGQEVRINKKESKILYAKNGKNVTIGKDKKVTQKIVSQKQSFNTVIVPYGKRTFITLSEGTKVWLNSGTKLIYPPFFAEKKREVYIEGEAVFEVTHMESRPFYVKTRDFDVKVLGTVFNVCAYADDKNSSTVLERGKVELSYKGDAILTKEKLTISPGTMAVFDPDKNNFSQQKVNPQDYISWHDGYLIFNNETSMT